MRIIPTYVLVVSLSIIPRAGVPQEKEPLLTDSIGSSTTRFAVERAVRAAVQRLERPECAKVLSDFRDSAGRTIQARLDLLGEKPRSYVRRIRFREPIDRRCQDAARAAFTFVGSPEVFICGTQFWKEYQKNPSYIEALMIHEIMHTLGLAENPPSSSAINERVLKRCWSSRPQPRRR